MIDTYVFFALAFTGIYAVMMTIEVWSLRAKMRDICFCIKCHRQIHTPHPTQCSDCNGEVSGGPIPKMTPYRSPDRPETPPPLKAPGPGRSRIG